MNILFLDWDCFGKEDTLSTFKALGHHYTCFFHEDYQEMTSESFTSAFTQAVSTEQFDCCFSYNYYPLLATCCKNASIKYISFVYDSPYVMLYSYTLVYPTNYVFLFDSMLYQQFKSNGIHTVYYMPLPSNPYKIDSLLKLEHDVTSYQCDVSFVGSLYNEKHNLFDRIPLENNEYLLGYLEGIMNAQQQVWGCNFIEDVLTPDIINQLQLLYPYQPNTSSVESPGYVYANYFINRKLTQIERLKYLDSISQQHEVKLYTTNTSASVGNALNMGPVHYNNQMPYVFHYSKINLNISLRSIQSGIPLRCMDIMASGGFLLTNYQLDFMNDFVPGKDFVYYEDQQDMLDKITYYLQHDLERETIAQNGRNKIKTGHTFETCFSLLFDIVFP